MSASLKAIFLSNYVTSRSYVTTTGNDAAVRSSPGFVAESPDPLEDAARAVKGTVSLEEVACIMIMYRSAMQWSYVMEEHNVYVYDDDYVIS